MRVQKNVRLFVRHVKEEENTESRVRDTVGRQTKHAIQRVRYVSRVKELAY